MEFPKQDHQRLHDVLLKCKGHVMVSYNCCPYILELYKEFYIFRTVRPNNMSQTAGSTYEELVMTNYDPRKSERSVRLQPQSPINLKRLSSRSSVLILFLAVCFDQFSDCFYSNCDSCFCIMYDWIFHSKCISFLISYYKEVRSATYS